MDIANDKLLKAAAIYGANASGKSNVYDAFDYIPKLMPFITGGKIDACNQNCSGTKKSYTKQQK